MELFPGCHKTELDNGMRVIVEEIPSSNSVSVGMWFNSGSRDEPEEVNGITHLIEHLIFRGTKNRSADEISAAVDRLGGRIIGGTGREYMVVYLDLLPETVSQGLKLLSDLALNPLFKAQDLNLEKKIVSEEIRSKHDDPQWSVLKAFEEALWGEHGLAKPIAGNEDSILKLNSRGLKERFDFMKAPENVAISAAGNLKAESFFEKVREYFHDLRGRNGTKDRPSPIPKNSGHVRVERDIKQTHFCIGGRGLENNNSDKYVLEMLKVILGGGMSSRLFRKVRKEEGLAYNISSNTEYYSDAGTFFVYSATDKPKLEKLSRLITKEFRDFRNQTPSEDELSLAKKKTKGNLVLGLESNQAHMVRLGSSLVYEIELDPVEKVLNRIDAVTGKDIRRIARKLLDEEKLSWAVLGPEASGIELPFLRS